MLAPLIAPFDPFDPAQISLWDGKLPPAWVEGGQEQYLLGTDNQGRDMLSTILYGGRLSIIVGLAAVALGMVLGVTLGVISGYFGGAIDTCDHAPRGCAIDDPRHPACHPDQRHRTGAPAARDAGGFRGLRGHRRHRPDRLAAVRPRDAWRDHGRSQQGIRPGCPRHRPAARG